MKSESRQLFSGEEAGARKAAEHRDAWSGTLKPIESYDGLPKPIAKPDFVMA
ncbi:hypothetical protein [Haloferula sp.]|uniref:hypothetical protein n=1 Tax=Haloferula sp. TaxID=2497595 RepID=UPI0032A0029E